MTMRDSESVDSVELVLLIGKGSGASFDALKCAVCGAMG